MDVPAPKESITVPAAPANEDTRYYVCDHLGTARVVMDAAGTVVERHDFEPFGVEIMPYQNTADNSHQYTGQERDASTQMDYMHFRYYGSNLGRFMKPDNVVAYAEYPQDWNLYSYALGNPVNLIDPTGHTPDDPLEDYDASHENSPDDLPSDRSDYDYWSQANRALQEINHLEANWNDWNNPVVQSGLSVVAVHYTTVSNGTSKVKLKDGTTIEVPDTTVQDHITYELQPNGYDFFGGDQPFVVSLTQVTQEQKHMHWGEWGRQQLNLATYGAPIAVFVVGSVLFSPIGGVILAGVTYFALQGLYVWSAYHAGPDEVVLAPMTAQDKTENQPGLNQFRAGTPDLEAP